MKIFHLGTNITREEWKITNEEENSNRCMKWEEIKKDIWFYETR